MIPVVRACGGQILEANNSDKSRILTMQIFLKDIKDFGAMNAG